MGVEEREDNLDNLKKKHKKKTRNILNLLKNNEPVDNKIILDLHDSAVVYFNAFERTLDEYSLQDIELSDDVITRKVEDTINMVDTIITHWKTIQLICNKFSLPQIEPSCTSYATIQRVIKRFKPDMVEGMKGKFVSVNLPLYGFNDKSKHSGWIKPNKVRLQLIMGIILLIVSGSLIFLVPNLTGSQYIFTRLILTLSVSLIGVATIEGSLKLNWSMTKTLFISATGWIAIFILIYFLNPPTPPKM